MSLSQVLLVGWEHNRMLLNEAVEVASRSNTNAITISRRVQTYQVDVSNAMSP
jgi:hypothetical protein